MSRSLTALFMMSAQLSFAAIQREIEYARPNGNRLCMDAGIPEGKGPFPAVILVHGGGWIRGDRVWNMQPLFEPLNEAGFAWFSISYRLATDFFQIGAAVDDVAEAVRYVREHAKKFNIDPDRIALLGESAGAHLASLAAMQQPASSVGAVVALYSPSDLETLARTSPAVPAQIREAIISSAFAGLLLDQLRGLSPIARIHSGLPPFLLIHGTADHLVPYEQSVRMLAKLREAGVPADLITVDRGGHGLRGWERAPAMAGYRREMLDWLRSRLSPQAAD